jgi:uncharacterized protein YneF (UPF0154 family)
MKNRKGLMCLFLLLIVISLQGCSAGSAYTDERNEFWIKDIPRINDDEIQIRLMEI